MSEEEKKAIEYWKRDIQLYHYNTQLASEYYAQIILNLIENQQKELNNLKEIEKSHQEENGKLRVELEQEKEKNTSVVIQYEKVVDKLEEAETEKNKELEEKLKIATAMLTKGTYPEQNEGDNDFDKQFIAVDKIKEKIKELVEQGDYRTAENPNGRVHFHKEPVDYQLEILKELLEE